MTNKLDDLAPIYRQTLQEVVSGRSDSEIARRLSISRNTVFYRLARLYEAAGVSESPGRHRRVLLVLWAIRQGVRPRPDAIP